MLTVDVWLIPASTLYHSLSSEDGNCYQGAADAVWTGPHCSGMLAQLQLVVHTAPASKGRGVLHAF